MALFKQAMAATNFFFPKKHIPILFHNCGDSGVTTEAVLYLDRAASQSWLAWATEPAARTALISVTSVVELEEALN